METEFIRINKFLSEAGVCSRRGADRLVEEGRVTIDGKVAVLGDQILPGQKVLVDGREVQREDEKILLAFHKPKGIVCTAEKREKNNIIDYLHYPKRIYPVGRLDKDSEGLILLTNDGELGNEILRARNFHEKEYIVTVNRPVTDEFLRGMAGGVPILDTITRKCKVEKLDKRKFRIVLTQGLNCHAGLTLKILIEEEQRDELVTMSSDAGVTVRELEKTNGQVVFRGKLETVSARRENGLF